jgi:SAM-dependent methyltransferase
LRWLLSRFFKEVESALAVARPATLLDVGCGEGAVTSQLAGFTDAKVIGVDHEDLAANWPARTTEKLTFQIGSGYELPFADETFDCVCALEVLEHVANPSRMLAEMRRVSARWLLLSVPDEPTWRIVHMLAGRDIRALGNTPGHINHWSRRRFTRFVGFHATVRRVTTPFPWLMVLAEIT